LCRPATSLLMPTNSLKPGFHSNASNARNSSVACVACDVCVAQTKHASNASACAGNHDWLLRSSIPIGWRLRSLREKSYAMTGCVSCVTCAYVLLSFTCVIFLRLLRFLRTFYFAYVFFLRKTLRALCAFEWKPGLTPTNRLACN